MVVCKSVRGMLFALLHYPLSDHVCACQLGDPKIQVRAHLYSTESRRVCVSVCVSVCLYVWLCLLCLASLSCHPSLRAVR